MSDVAPTPEAPKKRRGRPPKVRIETTVAPERNPREVLGITTAALELIRATATEADIRAIAGRALAA